MVNPTAPTSIGPQITTVLLDLDGVIRHFEANHRASIEAAAGLAPGTLWAAAFDDELVEQLVTGRITRAEWTAAVGAAVDNPDAAAEWLAEKGTVDQAMIDLIDQLRANGITAAVLTNGTDTIPAELDELGVTRHLDAIFNTAEIGYAKPDRRAFEHVCRALVVDPSEVFFTDDSERKLTGAIELGMAVEHFVGVDHLRSRLTTLGLLP